MITVKLLFVGILFHEGFLNGLSAIEGNRHFGLAKIIKRPGNRPNKDKPTTKQTILNLGAYIVPLAGLPCILLELDLFIFACLEVLRKTDCLSTMKLQVLYLAKLPGVEVFQPIMGQCFISSVALVIGLIYTAPSFLCVFSGPAVM